MQNKSKIKTIIISGVTLVALGYVVTLRPHVASTYAAADSTTSTSVEATTTTTTIAETTTVVETTAVSIDTPPTTTTPEWMNCPQFFEDAVDAGWSFDQIKTLDFIMFRESRCHMESYNGQDPAGGSFGLTQINGAWCNPSKYYKDGYLEHIGLIHSCEDLYYPTINLFAAKALYDYSLEHNGCGWNPWRISC